MGDIDLLKRILSNPRAQGRKAIELSLKSGREDAANEFMDNLRTDFYKIFHNRLNIPEYADSRADLFRAMNSFFKKTVLNADFADLVGKIFPGYKLVNLGLKLESKEATNQTFGEFRKAHPKLWERAQTRFHGEKPVSDDDFIRKPRPSPLWFEYENIMSEKIPRSGLSSGEVLALYLLHLNSVLVGHFSFGNTRKEKRPPVRFRLSTVAGIFLELYEEMLHQDKSFFLTCWNPREEAIDGVDHVQSIVKQIERSKTKRSFRRLANAWQFPLDIID